jgi:hypothetical protein
MNAVIRRLALIVPLVLVLAGCESANTQPTGEDLAASEKICGQLVHARFFPECWQRKSHELVRMSRSMEGQPAPNVERVWDKQPEEIVALIDDYGNENFNQDRIEQALICQNKPKRRQMTTCWGHADGHWYLLNLGSWRNAGDEIQPSAHRKRDWDDWCEGTYCTEDEYQDAKDEDDEIYIPPSTSY